MYKFNSSAIFYTFYLRNINQKSKIKESDLLLNLLLNFYSLKIQEKASYRHHKLLEKAK